MSSAAPKSDRPCGGCGKNSRSPEQRMKAAGRALVKMTSAEVLRRKAPKPLRKARLAVCDGCEKMRRVRGRRVCGEFLVETEDTCGCLLESKAALTDEQCPWRTPEHPMGKWAELTVDATTPDRRPIV